MRIQDTDWWFPCLWTGNSYWLLKTYTGHVGGASENYMIILGDLIHSHRLMAAGKIMVPLLHSLSTHSLEHLVQREQLSWDRNWLIHLKWWPSHMLLFKGLLVEIIRLVLLRGVNMLLQEFSVFVHFCVPWLWSMVKSKPAN